MRVLVTGSHGFVGRHFCKYFLDNGHRVTGLDNMIAGKAHEDWMFQPNDKTHFQQMFTDCRAFFNSASANDRFWGAATYDLIVHCAAVVGGRIKIEDDPLAVATDLSIDAEFFNWVVRAPRLPKVIYFSSSAAYPLINQRAITHEPLKESLINLGSDVWCRPDLTYGFAKLTGEYLAKFAYEKYGLDVKIYRPFGGYGEDQDLTYPFPSIIERVMKKHNPVVVWGSGEQERDFIHIDDVVEAVVQTYEKLHAGEALNLGNGNAVSFFQLAELVIEQAGTGASVINDPTKPEGVFSRVADVTALKTMYTPKITLPQGIQRALKRYKHG